MKKGIVVTICNLVCAVLLIAVLVMQFQPFWTCSKCKTHKGVDKEVSIAEYMWIPKHHEPIADDMTDLYREYYGPDYKDPATGRKFSFKPNYILPAMLTVFLGCIVGIVCCVIFHKKFFFTAIPLIVGIAGMLGHLSYPALQVGHNASTHLLVFIIVTAVSAVCFLLSTILAILSKPRKMPRQ